MSGHNKWSKIKNSKGAADAKRGKIFTKLGKELIVAAKMGGGNPEGNARLRQAIAAAKAASMPKDNIERAIKRGTGELGAEVIEEATYEAYGPGGVAVIVETASDNKNRTVSDLRSLLKSCGGHLAESGSVAWMFTHLGQILFPKNLYPEDKIMEVAIEAGALDVLVHDETLEVLTSPSDVYKVREAFEHLHLTPSHVGFTYQPKNTVPVDESHSKPLLEMLEQVEDHDDVQRVHCNVELT